MSIDPGPIRKADLNTMTLRRYFDERLDHIRSHIVRMANVSNQMIELAIEATLTGRPELLDEVIRQDDEVDFLESEILHETVTLVMREAPVANDLRVLAATLGVIGDLEKIADDAEKIAKRAQRIQMNFPGEMRTALLEMGVSARTAVSASVRLYHDYTPELMREIKQMDKQVDQQFAVARHRLVQLIQENPSEAERYFETIGMFHALEHVVDRALAVAKRLRMHYESPAKASPPGAVGN